MELMKERIFPRLAMHGHVLVRVQDGNLRRIPAYLDNMSLGGFKMMMSEDVEVGQPFIFKIKTPYAMQKIDGVGRVRHIAEVKNPNLPKYSVGVEFSAVDKNKVERILNKKIYGRYRRQNRKAAIDEIKTLLFLVPVLVLFAFIASYIYIQSDKNSRSDRAYEQDLKKGFISFLFNAK